MSADRLHSYKLLAELCDYPTARTAATARLTAMFLEDRCPEAASAIRRFVARVDGGVGVDAGGEQQERDEAHRETPGALAANAAPRA